jgi:hypothetical protein
VPRGPCPPAASADRVLFPLYGAIKQQASPSREGTKVEKKLIRPVEGAPSMERPPPPMSSAPPAAAAAAPIASPAKATEASPCQFASGSLFELSPLPLSLGSAFVASPMTIERLSVIM